MKMLFDLQMVRDPQVKKHFFTPIFSRTFILKACWICQSLFSTSIKMIMWFLSLCATWFNPGLWEEIRLDKEVGCVIEGSVCWGLTEKIFKEA